MLSDRQLTSILICVVVVACGWSKDLAEQGNEAFQEGQFAAAAGFYRQALEANPAPALQINLGHCYMRLERWGEAAAYYEAAIESSTEPVTAEVWRFLGQARHQSGQFDEALEAFLTAGSLDTSGTGPDSIWIARCLIELERWLQARSVLYDHIRRHPKDVEGLELLAYVLGQLDDWAGVMNTYQALLAERPGHTAYRIALANALAVGGQNRRAIDVLEFAWRTDAGQAGRVHRLLADLYLTEKMPHEAALCYARLVRESAKPTADDYLRLGDAYLQGKEPASARDAFEEMERADPNDARASLYLGRVATDLRRLEEAQAYYQAALKKDPTSVESVLALAQHHMGAQRYAEAAAYFARVLKLGDRRARVHYNHVLALMRRGDQDRQARIALQAALAQYPEDTQLRALLDEFVTRSVTGPPAG